MNAIQRTAARAYARQIAFSIACNDWRTVGHYYRLSMKDGDITEEVKTIITAMIDGYQDKLDLDNIYKF